MSKNNFEVLSSIEQQLINELKANDLLSQIILKGTTSTDFHVFVQDFMTTNRFRQTDFQTFDDAFSKKIWMAPIRNFPGIL